MKKWKSKVDRGQDSATVVDETKTGLRIGARTRTSARESAVEMQSGLPVWVAAFVGRELERAKVADLIADLGW